MTNAMKVIERKKNREGFAVLLEDGRYKVTFFDNGEEKELAESTFKRLYSITEEGYTPEVENAPEVKSTEEQAAPEVKDEPQANENDVPGENGLEDLLAGGQEVNDAPPAANETDGGGGEDNTPAPKPEPAPERTVQDLGLGITLKDWHMSSTRGGKCDKVTSVIEISTYIMDITEYNGFITDVRLSQVNPDAPENDPDAQYKEVYRSPKMSLKDTLVWMGLSSDDMKIARREITSIRKHVKDAHLEQLKEQEELESEKQSAATENE